MATVTEERLLSAFTRVEVTTDCWQWYGNNTHDKYGLFTWSEQGMSHGKGAHRLIYEALVGEVAEGMQLDHLCRNRLCVNPDHMEEVTPRENTLRGNGLAAKNARKTHCKWGHEFTEQNIYRPPKRPDRRYCKKCQYKGRKMD